MEDWSINVRHYAPNARADVIAGIIQYCGVALQRPEECVIVLTDQRQVNWMREHFLARKLGLALSDAELDDALAVVNDKMKAEQNKNRVTVYYLLAEHFGKLALFHGAHGHSRGWGGWVERCGCRRCGLFWFVLVLILLLLFGLLYLGLHKQATAPSTARPVPSAAVTAPAAIPSGAGIMTEVQDGKPVVIVYFDTGKATLSPDFETTAKSLKSFLNEHPASKLVISGYNDETGDSARNVELSKERAQAVQAALVTANIPMTSIELLKPMNTTDTVSPDAQARRVEVRVKDR